MKVILLEDIHGLGKKYDVKDVSDGHARNALIPNGLAQLATADILRELERLKARIKKEDADSTKRLTELARKIEKSSLEFPVRTDKNGTVFGSVNKEMILRALREHHWTTNERVGVHLEHSLKTLGEHVVNVDLERRIVAKLKIVLKPVS